MRLYRSKDGKWARSKAQAGRGAQPIDFTNNLDGIIELLNAHSAAPGESPAFKLGRSDAERGYTTNPYSSPDLRAEWEAGHAHAVELGLAPYPSFAVITRGVSRSSGKRKRAA